MSNSLRHGITENALFVASSAVMSSHSFHLEHNSKVSIFNLGNPITTDDDGTEALLFPDIPRNSLLRNSNPFIRRTESSSRHGSFPRGAPLCRRSNSSPALSTESNSQVPLEFLSANMNLNREFASYTTCIWLEELVASVNYDSSPSTLGESMMDLKLGETLVPLPLLCHHDLPSRDFSS
ncbi:hypothetical protein CDL12_21952 [Handroanthus impetiginosus]|uniref:Uncharacterized protein n=1 Tax=Handroanthus impetiginosus TaxID=429701 RepID=A0A2G9GJS8_9LAMI|nr:hypothetical protein CDL12_21952 [Handroanthus impetiginosus]